MPRVSSATDKYVGMRLRIRRTQMGWSQTRLGDAIGVTFQQIQKYEKGSNRIGAGRLHQIATLFNVEPGFFFEGAPAPDGMPRDARAEAKTDQLTQTLTQPGALLLVEAYGRIKDAALRRRIVDLVDQVAPAEVVPLRTARAG